MDQFTKEGRKLRPRKTTQSNANFERVDYGHSERKPRQHSEGRSYGENNERRSYGERKSYGERRPRQFGENSERRSYGDRKPRQFGEGRSYGANSERRSYGSGENRSHGERNSYGERSSYSERRPRQFGENSERRSYGDRKPRQFGEGRSNFGDRKPYGAKRQNPRAKFGSKFSKSSNDGINRMIERRPVINGSESFETYESPIKDVMRLNKFIANSGVCSRREADTLIEAGVVTVNGEVVTELGTKVNVFEDDIRFNGERLKGEEKMYLIMNKPKGFVTTASDPHADKTVIDLIKGCPVRVYPVGRLDKNTTGVLLLTNDGEIAERLTHPSYDKKKIYQVSLDRALLQEDYEKILSGIMLNDGEIKADELEYIDENDKRKLGIEIHSGKNRIVRRIFESLGYTVKGLDRVYFAGLTKKGLKKGEWRYLSEGEANILKMGAYV